MSTSESEWGDCPECGRECPTETSFKCHYANAHDEPYPWQYPSDVRDDVQNLYEDGDYHWTYREIASEVGLSVDDVDKIVSRGDFERNAEKEYRLRGESHPMWVDDPLQRYGPHFRKQALKARERDEYLCQWCADITNEEHIKTNNAGLDAHHIVKAEDFEDEEGRIDKKSAHALDNLVTLCRDCHRAAEKLSTWQVRQVLSTRDEWSGDGVGDSE